MNITKAREGQQNHKTRAEEFLGAEWRNGDVAVAQLTEALTHATLYLAEQQRIANLIAIYVASDANVLYTLAPEDQKKRWAAIRNQIEEGLGL